MRIGGWWRLWIGLSGLWVCVALAAAFLLVERPTTKRVAEDVGRWCDLDMPVTPDLAERVLAVPSQLAKLDGLDGSANAEKRKPIVNAIKSTVEAVTARAGNASAYDISLVQDPDGQKHVVIAPESYTEAQIIEQAGKDRYAANGWAKFGSYCTSQLQAQARNDLYPGKRKDWLLGTIAGILSFPLLSLLLGAFIGWVWRGFRPERPL